MNYYLYIYEKDERWILTITKLLLDSDFWCLITRQNGHGVEIGDACRIVIGSFEIVKNAMVSRALHNNQTRNLPILIVFYVTLHWYK